MLDPVELEEAYKRFSCDVKRWVPDGVISVDLQLLHTLGLLEGAPLFAAEAPTNTKHFFHVIETDDKVTLFNEQFAVWIVPKAEDEAKVSATMVYIAWLQGTKPHLEIVFSTEGVYNTPKFILKILERFLQEVSDTEAIIASIGKNP